MKKLHAFRSKFQTYVRFLQACAVSIPITVFAGESAKTAPVYLYRDDTGVTYTYMVEASEEGGSDKVTAIAVSEAEIDAIRKEGFEVSLLRRETSVRGGGSTPRGSSF